MTKLHAAVPKNPDLNGLDALNGALIKDPEAEHILIVVIDCKTVTTETDTGIEEATARVLRVEAVCDADLVDADRMLRAALTKRTGKSVLPFDEVTGEVLEGAK